MSAHEIIEYLRDLNIISIVIRIFMAVLLGGLIGLERGRKRQAAGFRTHMLVCLGSTLAMMTNQYICNTFGGASDPSRIGAQVVSGIGFLGAGTILITGNHQVRGLTTAAGLWASACMGLAIGIGFYEGAIIGFLFIFIVVALLGDVDYIFYNKSRFLEVYIEVTEASYIKTLLKYLRENNCKVYSMQLSKPKSYDLQHAGVFIVIKSAKQSSLNEIVNEIQLLEGIEFVECLNN